MSVFQGRRERLLSSINSGAYLVVDLARLMPKEIDHTSLYYLTGYNGEGVLIITQEESVLLTDSRYFESAKDQVKGDLTVHQAEGNYLQNIKEELERLSIKDLAFTSNRITYSLFTRLQKIASAKLIPEEDPVIKLRMYKDNSEIGYIKTAVGIAEEALSKVQKEIKVGMTEKDIATRLDILMMQAGSVKAFETIVAAGENCFNQHHKPGSRRIKEEDFLLIDFGARHNDYISDITRTFAVKKVTSKMEAIYSASLEATNTGIENLKPGKAIKDVWKSIDEYIVKTDFANDAEISGHCIGIDLHEYPFIKKEEEFILKPGIITTMEPGIYILGYGGVRIEDDVLVTENGPQVLTSFAKELTIVG